MWPMVLELEEILKKIKDSGVSPEMYDEVTKGLALIEEMKNICGD